MDNSASTSLVCSADVAAFVDALETINYNEAECYDNEENVVICITEQDLMAKEENELLVTDSEEVCTETDGAPNFYNNDTRKLKSIMTQLVLQKKAVIVKKTTVSSRGPKQFKSDVWNWFGDVRLFITENDADRLKIPYYIKYSDGDQIMICKVFVGCFRCSALFMYDAQRHSTSTLRYHVRACNRQKECIYVSEDRMDDEPTVMLDASHVGGVDSLADGTKTKRFRTDPRKQKEVIEQLFQKQRAVVTRKSFMNMKGNRRFKSDVWNWFGDIKLLISRSEAKALKIPYYIRRCGDEQMVLSKVFVGCFKCMALFIHDSQKSTSTLRYHIRTCSRPKERKKRMTPNIIFFPNQKCPKQPAETLPDGDAIPAHEKLLNFALSSESSMDVIRSSEFQKMLQMCITVGAIYGDVNVDSLLCPTPTLTSFILNDLYVTSINSFYTEFQHSYGATYKLSIWVDEQMKTPFISVYCSYANLKGELKCVTLHTDDFAYETKTPEAVREWFSQFLVDQPVVPYKRLMIIDNDSNFVTAFKDEQHVKCSVQHLTGILQSVSSTAIFNSNTELPDFTNLLKNCIDLVEYFEQISDQYPMYQELAKCVDEKWTSIVALFRSVESQYHNILSILNMTNETHRLSVEKSAISAVVEFFKVFEDAISQLSDTDKPTLNLVIPWVAKLERHCLVDEDESAALKQFKTNVRIEINDRLVHNISLYHRMATFLDPRFKKLVFGSSSEHMETTVKIKCLVKECMESPNMEDYLDSRKVHNDTVEGLTTTYEGGKCEKAALEEVDTYTSEPSLHLDFQTRYNLFHQDSYDVLKYWHENSSRFPNLSKVALWLLTCPAGWVQDTTESHWGNNWLVNCPRFPVPPENVNKVLFVKSYKGI